MADVVVRGLRFHVQRLGKGDRSVVFLHGLVMDNLSSWYFTLANAAAMSADVVLYDLRGHGASERPAGGYSVDDMLADLEGLLDALEISRPVQLVGNSFGGLLALKFAAAFPELTLSGAERDRKIAESFQHWLGRHSARKRTRLAQTAEAIVDGTSLVDDLRGSPPIADDDLYRVRCPVVAFYGERSDLRANAERLARTVKQCQIRIMPGCTHSVLWEATGAIRREVLDWLARS
jgi:pimeloyl-ACP methyl ester carboxylesterase